MGELLIGNVKGPQGETGETGEKGTSILIQGLWTEGISYQNNSVQVDVVGYNGSSYWCKQTHTATADTAPGNTVYWGILAEKGEQGETGEEGPPVPIVNDLTTDDTRKALSAKQGKILADRIGELSDLTTSEKNTIVGALNEVKAACNTLNSNLATPVRDTLWSGTAGANKTITLSKSLYDYNEVYFSNDVDGIRAKCLVTNNLTIIRAGGSTVTSAGNTATFGVTGDVSNEGKTIKITNVAYMTHIASGNNSALTARNIVSVIGIR